MRIRLSATDVWFKIALLFFFGGLYVAAIPYPEQSRQFPQLLAVASFVMTAIALAMDFTRTQRPQGEISGVDDTELKVLDAEARRARKKRYLQAWAIILVSTGIGFLGGFIFSALCLFAGFALYSGSTEKLARNLAVGVAMTGVVYLIFAVLMKVPLLNGVLW